MRIEVLSRIEALFGLLGANHALYTALLFESFTSSFLDHSLMNSVDDAANDETPNGRKVFNVIAAIQFDPKISIAYCST